MGNKNFVLRLFLVSLVGTLAGCPGGGGGDVQLTNAPSTDNPVGISLTYATMNGKTDSEIAAQSPSITDSSGNVYYNSTSFTITGTCSLGVGKVVAQVNGADVAETATCDGNGNFTWSKSFTAGTPETGTAYAVVLKPANTAGEVFTNLTASQYITKNIVIDDNAPAASTGAAVVGGTLVSGVWTVTGSGSSTTMTVNTTGPADLFRVVIDNYPNLAVTYTAGATPISFTDTLNEGVQKTFNVVVYDRAGNASPVEQLLVNFSSSVSVLPGYVDIKTLNRSSSNVNGADAVILLSEVGGNPPATAASTGAADTLFYFRGITGFSTQNP